MTTIRNEKLLTEATKKLPEPTRLFLNKLILYSIKNDPMAEKIVFYMLDGRLDISIVNGNKDNAFYTFNSERKQLTFTKSYFEMLRKLPFSQAIVSFQKLMRQAFNLALEDTLIDQYFSNMENSMKSDLFNLVDLLSSSLPSLNLLRSVGTLGINHDPLDNQFLAGNGRVIKLYDAVTYIQNKLFVNPAALDQLDQYITTRTMNRGQYFHNAFVSHNAIENLKRDLKILGVVSNTVNNLTYYYLDILADQNYEFLSTITFNPLLAKSRFDIALQISASQTTNQKKLNSARDAIALTFKHEELSFWNSLTEKQQETLDTLYMLKHEIIESLRGNEACMNVVNLCISTLSLNCIDNFLKCRFTNNLISYQRSSSHLISTLYGSFNITNNNIPLSELCEIPPKESLESLLGNYELDDGISALNYSFLYLLCKTLADRLVDNSNVSERNKTFIKLACTLGFFMMMSQNVYATTLFFVGIGVGALVIFGNDSAPIPVTTVIDSMMSFNQFTSHNTVNGFMKSALGSGIGFYSAKKIIETLKPANANRMRLP